MHANGESQLAMVFARVTIRMLMMRTTLIMLQNKATLLMIIAVTLVTMSIIRLLIMMILNPWVSSGLCSYLPTPTNQVIRRAGWQAKQVGKQAC